MTNFMLQSRPLHMLSVGAWEDLCSEEQNKNPLMSPYNDMFYARHSLVGNKIVDHLDVVGASPVGVAPTTSSFSTSKLATMDWAKIAASRDEKHLSWAFGAPLH